MKKILTIAFATAFIAVSSQAAMVNWSIKDKNLASMTVAVFNGDISSMITSWTNDTLTESEILAGLNGYDSTGTIKGTGKSSGTVAGTIASTLTYVVYDASAPQEGITFYVATSSTAGFIYDPDKQESAITPVDVTSFTARTWNPKSDSPTPPVPEPCTAALLAIGLAAFGLKRKAA